MDKSNNHIPPKLSSTTASFHIARPFSPHITEKILLIRVFCTFAKFVASSARGKTGFIATVRENLKSSRQGKQFSAASVQKRKATRIGICFDEVDGSKLCQF